MNKGHIVLKELQFFHSFITQSFWFNNAGLTPIRNKCLFSQNLKSYQWFSCHLLMIYIHAVFEAMYRNLELACDQDRTSMVTTLKSQTLFDI